MPSANTVAQKPAGNFNPLSSFEHAVLLDFLGGLSWFCAHTEEATSANVASAMTTNKRCLFELSNRNAPSRDGIVTKTRAFQWPTGSLCRLLLAASYNSAGELEAASGDAARFSASVGLGPFVETQTTPAKVGSAHQFSECHTQMGVLKQSICNDDGH